MTESLRPEALISTARRLAAGPRQGRPRQSDLRRAVSTAYYAVFHALARECADQMVGKSNRIRIGRAWSQVYRALDHSKVKHVCSSSNSRVKSAYKRFPYEIRAFGDRFLALQSKRHAADYDPMIPMLLVTGVHRDIDMAELAIREFLGANAIDRKAFCIFVTHDLRG